MVIQMRRRPFERAALTLLLAGAPVAAVLLGPAPARTQRAASSRRPLVAVGAPSSRIGSGDCVQEAWWTTEAGRLAMALRGEGATPQSRMMLYPRRPGDLAAFLGAVDRSNGQPSDCAVRTCTVTYFAGPWLGLASVLGDSAVLRGPLEHDTSIEEYWSRLPHRGLRLDRSAPGRRGFRIIGWLGVEPLYLVSDLDLGDDDEIRQIRNWLCPSIDSELTSRRVARRACRREATAWLGRRLSPRMVNGDALLDSWPPSSVALVPASVVPGLAAARPGAFIARARNAFAPIPILGPHRHGTRHAPGDPLSTDAVARVRDRFAELGVRLSTCGTVRSDFAPRGRYRVPSSVEGLWRRVSGDAE